MQTITCHLVSAFDRPSVPTIAKLKLPAVPRVGETILVGPEGQSTRAYKVKDLAYQGVDQSHKGSDDRAESFVVLLVHDV